MYPAFPTTDAAANLTQRAQALLDLGRPADAVPILLDALNQAPRDHRALCLMALAHSNLGNRAEAVRWADQAIEAAPGHEWGHRLRAISLLELGRVRDAQRAAEEAVRLGPEYPETLHTLSRVLLRAGRRREAEAMARRMLALAPDSFLTHEMLALVALRGEKWQDAEAYCRRALTLRPNAYYSLNNLGLTLFRQSNAFTPRVSLPRFTEAIDCLQRAIALNPAEKLARENLSATLSRYLLTYPLFVLCAFTVGMLFRVGDLTGTDKILLRLLVFPALAIVYCVILGLLRYRALPPDVQTWWRRERWRRWRRRRV